MKKQTVSKQKKKPSIHQLYKAIIAILATDNLNWWNNKNLPHSRD